MNSGFPFEQHLRRCGYSLFLRIVLDILGRSKRYRKATPSDQLAKTAISRSESGTLARVLKYALISRIVDLSTAEHIVVVQMIGRR